MKTKKSSTKDSKQLFETNEPQIKEEKTSRSWFDVSEKISKKDMDKIDVSLVKGGEIDI